MVKRKLQSIINYGAFIVSCLIRPESTNEDRARREFIMNIFLLSASALAFVMFLILIFRSVSMGDHYNGLSPIFLFLVFFTFLFLLFLSKKGFSNISSYIFIFIYFLPTTYVLYKWGANVPQGLLFFALIIIVSGVLISTFFSFFITFLACLTLFALGYLQIRAITSPDLYWKQESLGINDLILYILTFVIITIAAWLSNREIERSLKRARASEAALKKERDTLEIKVEERTKELRKIQMEKMQGLLRFAEFGRLSSGLFHDLINPMTAVSLNLHQIEDEGKAELIKAKSNLTQAIQATKRMEEFIVTVRKQLQKQENKTDFSLDEEIGHAIQLLSHKARKNNVALLFKSRKKIGTFGSQIKFNQAIINFISNAIDSYKNCDTLDKKVCISLDGDDKTANISIQDHGCGIAEENLRKIFEPFFTTKEGGIGLGLSSSKNTVENDFRGRLEIKSEPRKGTEILITFPIISNGKNK
ncbi:MAG: ATP-binding protein [Patescibacteria group bacterium]